MRFWSFSILLIIMLFSQMSRCLIHNRNVDLDLDSVDEKNNRDFVLNRDSDLDDSIRRRLPPGGNGNGNGNGNNPGSPTPDPTPIPTPIMSSMIDALYRASKKGPSDDVG